MEFISEEMQKANRLALADHIEKNVTDEQYYHQAFINPVTGAMCAHAHAAAIGMCGLILEKDYGPSHPDPDLSSAFVNAKHFFGYFIIDKVFDNPFISNREQIIQALRQYTENNLFD